MLILYQKPRERIKVTYCDFLDMHYIAFTYHNCHILLMIIACDNWCSCRYTYRAILELSIYVDYNQNNILKQRFSIVTH